MFRRGVLAAAAATLALGGALLVTPTRTARSAAPDAASANISLKLKVNGADLMGDGPGGAIPIRAYESSVTTAREAGTGLASGRRQYEPIKVTKNIDNTSPLLEKALDLNQMVEGTFTFTNPGKQGFYTVRIREGRVSAIAQHATDNTPTEDVSFVFHTIEWTAANGTTYMDTTGSTK